MPKPHKPYASPDDRDMDGDPRFVDGTVDIGADESDGTLWNLHPAVLHVAPDGSDFNDGLTWGRPLRTVKMAVSITAPGDEVWVREGTYEDVGWVYLGSGVGVYGGSPMYRDGSVPTRPKRHPVVLNADILRTAVICFNQTDEKAVVDGFTIQGKPGHRGYGVIFSGSRLTTGPPH